MFTKRQLDFLLEDILGILNILHFQFSTTFSKQGLLSICITCCMALTLAPQTHTEVFFNLIGN